MRLGLKVRTDPFHQAKTTTQQLTTGPMPVEHQAAKQMKDLSPFELTHQQIMSKGPVTFKAAKTALKEEHQILVCHHCNRQVQVADALNDQEAQLYNAAATEELAVWADICAEGKMQDIIQNFGKSKPSKATVAAADVLKHNCAGCQHFTCGACQVECVSCYKKFCKFCIDKSESICEEDRRCSGCETMY